MSNGLHELLKNKLNKVDIDGQTFYVAEGDTLLDDTQLKTYAEVREQVEKAREAAARADAAGFGSRRLDEGSRGLIAMTQGGKIVRWKAGSVLSYRVAKSTFQGNDAHYRLVVDSVRKAAAEWEATCGVNFEHRADLDDAPGVGFEGTVFVVRELDVHGTFIAAGFFPNDPKERRRLIIDPSYYTTTFDRVGVLRHELGHVLGFRHEHIRSEAPPVCPNESLWDTKFLTKYDPTSVMHYFCGGVGTNELKISALDRKGAQQVYGPPLASTALADVDV
jgi:predicted Zn-dependent protease